MKKTNRKLTAGIGLALGITIFAGAALANYNTANGYDTFKTAAKGLLSNENYTMNAKISFSIDGEEIAGDEFTELYDRDGDVKLNKIEKSVDESNLSSAYKQYLQDNTYVSISETSNGYQSTSVYDNAEEYMGRGTLDSMTSVKNDDDKKTVNKIVHFAELAADTFVGDLKNNIVYVSGDDDSSTYEMGLEAVQIPELVNAGLSAMFSSINSINRDFDEESRDPFLVLGTDPILKNASLKFTVDNEGRFTYVLASLSMTGNGHDATVSAELNISDYGATKPERVDIDSLPNVRRHNYRGDMPYEHFESTAEVSEKGYHVTENGEVLDENDYVVGYVEIDSETGEGKVVID